MELEGERTHQTPMYNFMPSIAFGRAPARPMRIMMVTIGMPIWKSDVSISHLTKGTFAVSKDHVL